jgi:hypothetical protein
MKNENALRNEVNTRFRFAKKQAEFWFKQIANYEKTGNIVSCYQARKYRQAGRIYDHYQKEFTKFIKEQ